MRFSIAYHPQTDKQSKQTLQILEDLLKSDMLDLGGSWEEHLMLVEFASNNSFQSSISTTPFEEPYGRPC